MEKLQAKGEVAEEELKALEMDVTGKVSPLSSLYYSLFIIFISDPSCLMAWCSIRGYASPQGSR